MGQRCCKPSRKNYSKLENEIRPFSFQLHQRVLPYETALEEAETSHCVICLESQVADEKNYRSWENSFVSDLELLNAPPGVFGSLCQCKPEKTLIHLHCLAQQIDSLTNDSSARRTCGLCNTPWIVIQTQNPGRYINLTPLPEPNEDIPAWRWNDIEAGIYWVRILAGNGASSSPANVNLNLPDAYKTVEMQIYNRLGHLVDISPYIKKKSTARKFSKGLVGRFITWREVREILDLVENL